MSKTSEEIKMRPATMCIVGSRRICTLFCLSDCFFLLSFVHECSAFETLSCGKSGVTTVLCMRSGIVATIHLCI